MSKKKKWKKLAMGQTLVVKKAKIYAADDVEDGPAPSGLPAIHTAEDETEENEMMEEETGSPKGPGFDAFLKGK